MEVEVDDTDTDTEQRCLVGSRKWMWSEVRRAEVR
jgi:hypothetical protein